MLAELSSADGIPGGGWVYELKYDGFRALAAVAGDDVILQSRNALDLSGRFPGVADALRALGWSDVVLDGEIIACDRHGRQVFEWLAAGKGDIRYVAFDLLWQDGRDLRGEPFSERRAALEALLSPVHGPISIAERLMDDRAAALEEVRRRKAEGLIAKREDGAYVGRRSTQWRKIKVRPSQDVAIVGFTPISSGGPAIGALLVAVRSRNRFVYAGKVGTGYDERGREELYKRLSRDRVERPPVADPPRERGAVWVRPTLVAEVEYTEWTEAGRLRQPSFKGLRIDRAPEEVRREEPTPLRGEVRAPGRAAARQVREEAGTRKASGSRGRAGGVGKAGGKRTPPVIAERIELTHPDRVVYPAAGYTKADVFQYMGLVAPLLVDSLEGRPLSLQQWPQGILAPGFFRQDVDVAPEWVTRVAVDHEDGARVAHHPIIDKPETVLWLANQSALALHMWSSRVPRLDRPTWIVFDLDPGGGTWAHLIDLALMLRGFLNELGLESFPKTSGKRGLHLIVPIRPGPSHELATRFAVEITTALAHVRPDVSTVERMKAKRGGRLYLDALQNGYGKTIIAPYSLRDTPQATVSAPLDWSEVTVALDPKVFTLKTMPSRVDEVGDLFAGVRTCDQALPKLA